MKYFSKHAKSIKKEIVVGQKRMFIKIANTRTHTRRSQVKQTIKNYKLMRAFAMQIKIKYATLYCKLSGEERESERILLLLKEIKREASIAH